MKHSMLRVGRIDQIQKTVLRPKTRIVDVGAKTARLKWANCIHLCGLKMPESGCHRTDSGGRSVPPRELGGVIDAQYTILFDVENYSFTLAGFCRGTDFKLLFYVGEVPFPQAGDTGVVCGTQASSGGSNIIKGKLVLTQQDVYGKIITVVVIMLLSTQSVQADCTLNGDYDGRLCVGNYTCYYTIDDPASEIRHWGCRERLISFGEYRRTHTMDYNLQFDFSDLNSLAIFEARNNLIEKITKDTFKHVKSLQHIDLSNNLITDIDIFSFKGLEHLFELDLSNNHLSSIIATNTFSVIYLDNNMLDTIDLNEISSAGIPEISIGYNLISCDFLVKSKKRGFFGVVVTTEIKEFHSENVDGISCKGSNFDDNQQNNYTEKLTKATNSEQVPYSESQTIYEYEYIPNSIYGDGTNHGHVKHSSIHYNFPIQRPIGRPRYRWLDEVRKDLCDMQVADWRLVVQDRNNWRSLVSEAKIHFGSLSRRSYVASSIVVTWHCSIIAEMWTKGLGRVFSWTMPQDARVSAELGNLNKPQLTAVAMPTYILRVGAPAPHAAVYLPDPYSPAALLFLAAVAAMVTAGQGVLLSVGIQQDVATTWLRSRDRGGCEKHKTVKLWNDLPLSLRESPSVVSFRESLKKLWLDTDT
ncbi:hypothetical protein MSG28_008458 [Choristoneura fumiferana]|uniref:Uncharacterized protein n=1 Tax=Choristoneura fumiferana TaxID=7141 RepID=A0ACC0J6A8_CHOFU|nr:hypothetical protein MSG28_008458 [Choristoneura fumiferana]